ncbi:hypothetical protein T265_08151 [Opisthorchis viverrini]|uniref:Uncharacterized protein n=1 Tax=Opisthorchis viverrini TaxID=6198 RepID=A0A075A9B9_OPIVI|nr:hypothetical protein T265_08151 [Opisthorchis viverrini]KER24109.1 hypothetical protein T265_08151 [Opisthorchis viverrini]
MVQERFGTAAERKRTAVQVGCGYAYELPTTPEPTPEAACLADTTALGTVDPPAGPEGGMDAWKHSTVTDMHVFQQLIQLSIIAHTEHDVTGSDSLPAGQSEWGNIELEKKARRKQNNTQNKTNGVHEPIDSTGSIGYFRFTDGKARIPTQQSPHDLTLYSQE